MVFMCSGLNKNDIPCGNEVDKEGYFECGEITDTGTICKKSLKKGKKCLYHADQIKKIEKLLKTFESKIAIEHKEEICPNCGKLKKWTPMKECCYSNDDNYIYIYKKETICEIW
uniref:Uncharacterized protein n=1 Tax=Pithovirus LCPAC403 TaxID=2506596 RepID=A0A481ZAH9_9VIRU|nr:MAG: hypothetical protein LCPAC403_00520 [Pithovirus LCPAC403]